MAIWGYVPEYRCEVEDIVSIDPTGATEFLTKVGWTLRERGLSIPIEQRQELAIVKKGQDREFALLRMSRPDALYTPIQL